VPGTCWLNVFEKLNGQRDALAGTSRRTWRPAAMGLHKTQNADNAAYFGCDGGNVTLSSGSTTWTNSGISKMNPHPETPATKEEADTAYWRPRDWILGTTLGQWAVLGSVMTVLVLLGTASWSMTGGNDEADSSWHQSFWMSWCFFIDPGTQTGLKANEFWRYKLVAALFSVGGFAFNLAVFGLVVDTIRETLKGWKQIHGRVVANRHQLVLGWNAKSLFLLQELVAANSLDPHPDTRKSKRCGCICRCRQYRKRQIVVLANRSELAMQQDVRMHFESMHMIGHNDIVFRCGEPRSRTELMKACAASAEDILIMGTGCEGSDQDVIQILLALAALPHGLPASVDVFAEMQNHDSVSIVRDLLPVAEGIVARNAVNRIMILRAIVPSVGYCYLDMVSFTLKNGNELYLRPVPQALISKTFHEASFCFPHAVLCGVKSSLEDDTSSELVPQGERVLCEGDQLVMLARTLKSADTHVPTLWHSTQKPQTLCYKVLNPISFDGHVQLSDSCSTPKTILIIGCPSDFPDFLAILDTYLAPGSLVHILSQRTVQWRIDVLKNWGEYSHRSGESGHEFRNIQVKHYVGPTSSKKALSALPLADADCALILAETESQDKSPVAADSRNLTSVITLRGVLPKPKMGKGKKCKVVTEILDSKTQHVVATNSTVRRHGSFVYSNALETGLFAIAAEAKAVYSTLMHLLNPDSGAGFIITAPIRNFLQGTVEELSFLDLHSRVTHACSGVLLGWRRVTDPYPELNPQNKMAKLDWDAARSDELIIIHPQPPMALTPSTAVSAPWITPEQSVIADTSDLTELETELNSIAPPGTVAPLHI